MTVGIGHYVGIFGAVALGAVIPIVPTGAAVSVGAVLAAEENAALVALVVLIGAAGAYVGDLIVYAGLRFSGDRLGPRLRPLRPEARTAAMEKFQQQIENHEVRTLLLSRLVPAGRLPVLVAAAIGGYPFRRYATADLVAALLWSTVYAAIGLIGGSVFPETWQGVLAAIVLVLLVSFTPQLWRVGRHRFAERRQRRTAGTSPVRHDAATPDPRTAPRRS
jgi:membrane protein DedA with SNARE-associated domain